MRESDGKQHTYICIDLKSFFASVECVERGLDPLTTRLVVADAARTEKTICLAVTPALKAYGISGRARLFEVVQKAKEYGLDYIVAPPRMSYYVDYSTKIYDIYMKYVAPEDVIVYSIDEVFMDVTDYLGTYGLSPHDLARKMIGDVLEQTGITATAGIGTNLFLAKVAMDVVAKHIPADADGVRIAELDERSYREQLWGHRPITDIWRVGRGTAKKLAEFGMYTMGDVARCSLTNEDLLYKLFGVAAELLIDHAWGVEPCTIADVLRYIPLSSSLTEGQVLQEPYDFHRGRVIVMEMTDTMALMLLDKKLLTDQVVLTVGYDIENLRDPARREAYRGEITTDFYGRQVPKHAHGSENLGRYTSSVRLMTDAMLRIYDRIVDPHLLIRRLSVVANHVIPEGTEPKEVSYEQFDLFTDQSVVEKQRSEEEQSLDRERKAQEAFLNIKKKYGKNAILKGTNFREGATGIERNAQIGGHKA